MNYVDMMNKVFAGIIAGSFGLLVSLVTYIFLGYITEPLKEWVEHKLLGGTK
jgi:hypothetical protein